ncbi:HEAT repeat domain-containing protein [Alicyclobacillus fodiniaquatilis]|uniref:HEAT repeat domain-containing protein n=1 Tax=Alicyclobacillus fodiniaquatilis TaxID=1661150 RepID=A0ABW4JJR3_9BACL
MPDADLYSALVALAKGAEKSRQRVATKLASAPLDVRKAVFMRGITSKNPKIRRATCALVGELREEDALPEMLNALQDAHQDVVQMAVWSIGRMQVRAAIPALVELIASGCGFKVAKTAVWAFGEIGDDGVLPTLSSMLQDPNARLCEGILVCGIKLGHKAFVELLQALDCAQPQVQNALRDASYASGEIRGALMRAVIRTKDAKTLVSILAAIPYATLHEADYERLLASDQAAVREATYRSIAHCALRRNVKREWLLGALDDASNQVVITALQCLAEYMNEDGAVIERVQWLFDHHPSPKIRSVATDLLQRRDVFLQVRQLAPKWRRFVLETLPGLESFVAMEADCLGIVFQTQMSGAGWLEVRLDENSSSVAEMKSMHTISRICAVASVTDATGNCEVNPYLQALFSQHGVNAQNGQTVDLEQVRINGQVFAIAPLIEERDMRRPARKLRATSLDWRVARAMVLCTKPKPDDVFVDPTCGSGTLLLERATIAPYQALIGGDCDRAAVAAAQHNLKHCQDVMLHEWDAVSTPLAAGSVDVVVANLPFGRRVGNHEGNVALYPALLKEVIRILRVGGCAVFLTQEIALLSDVVQTWKSQVVCELDQAVAMGGLAPHLFCIRKVR